MGCCTYIKCNNHWIFSMVTTRLRGRERGCRCPTPTTQHRKSLCSKVRVNDVHIDLENMVFLLILAWHTICLTWMHWHKGSPGLLCSRANLLAQAMSPIEAVNRLYHHIPGMPAPTGQHTGTCLLPPTTQRENSVLQHEISAGMLTNPLTY